MKNKDYAKNFSTSDLEAIENFKELLTNINMLKNKKNGCPWLKKQSHKSLIPYLIEESYEVIDSIEDKDKENMAEELGDILFQVMLHSEIASKKKEFEIKDVLYLLNKKIRSRYPYIFEKNNKVSIKESKAIWKERKYLEKGDQINKKINSYLSPHLKDLPSTLITNQIVFHANRYGFQWEKSNQIFNKINEEIEELKEAIKNKKRSAIKEEFGDVYFTLINLSFFLRINHEESLKESNKKFIKRFSIIENIINDKNNNNIKFKDFKGLWKLAKTKIKESKN